MTSVEQRLAECETDAVNLSRCGCNELAANIRWLIRQASEVHRDTVRFDWMERTRRGVVALTADDPSGEPTRHLWIVDDVLADGIRCTVREAIDAAMPPDFTATETDDGLEARCGQCGITTPHTHEL